MTMTRQERAQADLAKKISLENTFKVELLSLYSDISRNYKNTIRRTGAIPDAAIFHQRFKLAVEKQYRRVFSAFASSARDQKSIQLKQDETEDQLTEEVIAVMLLLGAAESTKTANEITQTNQRYFSDAYSKALNQLIQEGEGYTNEMLALLSVAVLDRSNGGRVGITATSETQWAAESTKFTESEIINGIAPSLLIIAQGGTPIREISGKKKDWATIIDGRQRPAHNAANRQVQAIEDPFVVGGELMMYPADTSLGASKKNVIGCRCVAIY